MLCRQVQGDLALVRRDVHRGTRFQHHFHGLLLALPSCVVQGPHACGRAGQARPQPPRHADTPGQSLQRVGGPRPRCQDSPLLSLMSTAACASSSSEMSSVLPLSAAWCRAENLGTVRSVRGPTSHVPSTALPAPVRQRGLKPASPAAPQGTCFASCSPPRAWVPELPRQPHLYIPPWAPGERAAAGTSRGRATSQARSRPCPSVQQGPEGWTCQGRRGFALQPITLFSFPWGAAATGRTPPACAVGRRAGVAAELGAGASGSDLGMLQQDRCR